MDPFAELTSKSVLEIAGELGVRSSSVQKALQELGVTIDDPTSPIDPDLEEVLIEHLIDQGTVPSKFKRPKRNEYEPVISDDLLLEALGAGEDGFSEQRIPRQLRVESGFVDKPSWFERFFGKKKERDLVRSLKEYERSNEDLDAFFSSVEARAKGTLRSPIAHPAADDFYAGGEEIKAPTIELSNEILDEFDDLDMDGIEDLADIELEGFEELGKEAVAAQPEEEPEDIDDTEVSLDEEIEDLDTSEEGEEEAEEGETEGEAEEVIPVGMFERLLSRIHLTPAEMWAVTGGSLAIMLVLLGITVYWYMYKSDLANDTLWKQAELAYIDASKPVSETIPGQIQDFEDAADLLLQYIEQFPTDLNVEQAFEWLCKSHFEKAQLHQSQPDQTDQMDDEYRQSINYYNQYLNRLEKNANLLSERLSLSEITEENKQEQAQFLSQTFPDPEKQEIAMSNIGFAHWQLGEYQEAVDAYRAYLNKFSGHEHAPQIRLNIGEIYKQWAEKNTENAFELYDSADFAYNDAINQLPENAHAAKMKLYKGLGEIKFKKYERHRLDNQTDAMQDPLDEAIAYLQNAYDEAQAAGDNLNPNDPGRIQVYKFLGDLNLTRGEIAVEKLEELERVKADFRDGDFKTVMEKGANDKREEANLYLQNSLALYNDLLETKELLEDQDHYVILYNKANGHRLLKQFDDALATAKELNEELGGLTAPTDAEKDLRIQNAYLLGHIAWDKAKHDYILDILANQRQSQNPSRYYTDVKKYYQEALLLDGYYPKLNGIISHLADIRLTNVLYLQEQRYEEAISRFDNMVKLWPENDYSYLTYYFYGKTLELFGDEKQKELEKVNQEITQFGISPTLYEQQQAIENEMKQLYQRAIIQYGKAVEVRPNSQYVDIDDEKYLVEIHFHRGFSAFKQKNFINDPSKLDAENLLNKALQDYRNHPVAREKYVAPAIERLGDLYAGIGLYDTAIDKYREYIDSGYEDADSTVRMKLADTYLDRLSYDEARLWYQRIIDENPPPTTGDLERAKKSNRIIERGPAYGAYKKLAKTYLTEATVSPDNRHQKLQDALNAYQEFARKYPIDPENKMQNKDEIRIPIDSEAQLIIGNIYDELEDYPNAAKNLLQFLELNPTYPEKGQIYNKIGKAYIQAGMIDDAIDKLYLISEKDIANPSLFADVKMNLAQAYQLKARDYQAQGDDVQFEMRMQDAIKTYSEVIRTNAPAKAAEAQTLQRGLWQELKNRQEQQQNLGG